MLVGGTAVVLGAIGSRSRTVAGAAGRRRRAVGPLALTGPWLRAPDRDAGSLGRLGRGPLRRAGGHGARTSPMRAKVTGAAGVAPHSGGIAWYRTTFTVPATARYAMRFESVNHRAPVWLDGRASASHTGEYLPFEVALRLRDGRRAHARRARRLAASRRSQKARAGTAHGSTSAASTAR